MNTTLTYKSFFTRDVLIPVKEDGKTILELNVYGQLGKFIAEVQFVDQDNKKIKRHRFESQLLQEDQFTTENWHKFDEQLIALAEKMTDKFGDYGGQEVPKVKFNFV